MTGGGAAVASANNGTAARLLPYVRELAVNWGYQFFKHGGKMYAIEHIMYRHGLHNGWVNVSRSLQGTTIRNVEEYVDVAVR